MKCTTLLCALVLMTVPATVNAQDGDYRVVVNAANPVSALSKSELSRIFLKRQASWKHGGSIAPVDLDRTSRARSSFTKVVHGRNVSAIGTYWQQQIFAGKDVPPPEKQNDQEVLEFVRSNPKGIGYVSANTTPVPGTKTITITP
jgi:ABC-type phosphate transport system substrate-binding protein